MIFRKLELVGAYEILPEKIEDERGFFARTFCQKEFEKQNIPCNIVQCNTSFNKKKGTLRGMHFQIPPFEEIKIVRCTKGAIFDVIIDLRKDSPTFKKWIGLKLSEKNQKLLYIPKGFAHGFQTLENNCKVFYQVSAFYEPSADRGVRWDDPAFGILWPIPVEVISQKDSTHPLIS